jgi:RNA polymerase sigma-70 factor (ECF subfamily)
MVSERGQRATPTDRELVGRVRADSDQAAFKLLYTRYAPEVMRLLRRLLSEAELADAAQESFVRLHRGLREGYDLEQPLRPYVLRIARNVSIAVLRQREKQGKLLRFAPAAVVAEGTPDRDALEGERDGLIHEALQALSPEHRSAVVLRYAHGLSMREVAQALACTERTVRNRLRAAAVLLERELRRRGVVDGNEEVSS